MSTILYDPDAELERLYAAITGRPAFSYDPASDPVYNSYARSYRRRGRLAMRDTMGQAAALTGGYGSSYAQSVGQQQYDSYLQSLGEALPELYGMAWQRYNAEGDALKTAWELASERSEVRRESEREAAEREAAAQKSAETARRGNYDRLYKLIYNSGYNPNETELSDSGMTGEQAAALLSGDRKTFELFRCEAPELLHLPEATFDWYCRNYLDRDYPLRMILRLNGVEFPERLG